MTTFCQAGVLAIFAAKTVRTFCYGFLGIVLPVYLSDLGLSAAGLGVAVTLTLAGSAALTWLVRRPAERYGARAALLALGALSAVAAVIFLSSRDPRLVVLAAILGNVAVGTGETGPFLTLEQVRIARAVPASRRTVALSVYNFLGYAAAALGAVTVGALAAYRPLFVIFLAGAAVQCAAYACLPREASEERRRPEGTRLPSAPLIRRLAALGALDSFAGGFVLQSLVVYFFHERYALGLEALGYVFFATQILTAASLLLAARAAARFGLLADGCADPAGVPDGARRGPRAGGGGDHHERRAHGRPGGHAGAHGVGHAGGGARGTVRGRRRPEDRVRPPALLDLQRRQAKPRRVSSSCGGGVCPPRPVASAGYSDATRYR